MGRVGLSLPGTAADLLGCKRLSTKTTMGTVWWAAAADGGATRRRLPADLPYVGEWSGGPLGAVDAGLASEGVVGRRFAAEQ
ncbi:hypothetical protein KRMM14A1004_15360 [Krasilnikovia sp. MM14-A1004]